MGRCVIICIVNNMDQTSLKATCRKSDKTKFVMKKARVNFSVKSARFSIKRSSLGEGTCYGIFVDSVYKNLIGFLSCFEMKAPFFMKVSFRESKFYDVDIVFGDSKFNWMCMVELVTFKTSQSSSKSSSLVS